MPTAFSQPQLSYKIVCKEDVCSKDLVFFNQLNYKRNFDQHGLIKDTLYNQATKTVFLLNDTFLVLLNQDFSLSRDPIMYQNASLPLSK